MPYEIVPDHPECDSEKPVGVENPESGNLHGCHEDEDAAREQQKALYASKDESIGRQVFREVQDKDASKVLDRLVQESKKVLWISPTGREFDITGSNIHASFVIENPRKFGLDSDTAESMRNEMSSTGMVGGRKSKDQVLAEYGVWEKLFNEGWLRVRKNSGVLDVEGSSDTMRRESNRILELGEGGIYEVTIWSGSNSIDMTLGEKQFVDKYGA